MVEILAIVFVFAAQPMGEPGVPKPAPGAKSEKTANDKTPATKTAVEKPKDLPPEEESPDEETDDESDNVGNPFVDWLDRVSQSGLLGLLRRGGYFMAPILLLGIIACGVMIERYRSLKMLDTDSSRLRNSVRELLQQDRAEEALELCDRERGPVPAILASGVRKYLVLRRLDYDPAKVEEQVIKAMDDYSVHVVSALEKHLPILATISSVAPMLGFLGTVAGMIVSFDEIQAKINEAGNIVELAAGGISIALLTTAFGLIIGIPSYMAFNYFTGVINRFVLEVEESATELIEVVTLHLALEQRAPRD